ncbi:thioredoxin-like protein [Xylaria flabelliformis]|nr:thioredoxin-like protein [Xylaria flabelliformis]KAI0863137.1 thioredoxin-like protein [Xylaria cubensis]
MSFRAATHLASRRAAALPTLNHRLSAVRQFHTTLPNMTVHNIETKAAFDEAVKKYPVVIVDAFATWCGPCKAIAPIVAKMSEEDRFKDFHFVKIDVDHLPDLSQELGITAMPTFIAFKDGDVNGRVTGAIPQEVMNLVTKQI